MKINKRTVKKANVYILTLIILTVLASYVLTAKLNNYWPFRPYQNVDTAEVSKGRLRTAENQSSTSPIKDTDSKTPINNEAVTEKPIDSNTLQATISASNQTETNLQIRVNINSVTSAGECTLVLSNGVSRIERTAGIQPVASSSTCKGFDISLSELPAGAWNLTIDVITTDKKAHLTKNIIIT